MSESTKINGTTVKYNTDGHNVCVIAKNSEISMENRIAELHKLDRSHYDTPASIQNCCCESCNAARKQHGLTAKKWNREDYRRGELKSVRMNIIDIENLIRMENQNEYINETQELQKLEREIKILKQQLHLCNCK